MADLLKTTTVLHRQGQTGVYIDPDPEGRDHCLVLDHEIQAELGVPATITVTIEPGDTLNDG